MQKAHNNKTIHKFLYNARNIFLASRLQKEQIENTHMGCSSYEESGATIKKATVGFADRAMQKNKKKAHQTIQKYIFDLANFGGSFESTLKKSLQIEHMGDVVRMGSQAPYSKKLLSVFLIVYMQTHNNKKNVPNIHK